jgi:hypothetical protein
MTNQSRGSRPPPITEPIPIEPEFVSGPASVTRIGPVVHMSFYLDQVEPPELSSAICRHIRRRLIVPRTELDRFIRMLEAARDGATETIENEAHAASH